MPIWAWTLIAVFAGALAGAVWFLMLIHVGSSTDVESGAVTAIMKRPQWVENENGRAQFFGKGETISGWIEGDDFCFSVQYQDGFAVFKTPIDNEFIEIIR